MQDIRDLESGGLGERRLRLHHNQNQALKCPRCDSLNTKFCYYNNYNLSQPRHFCKGCRRYWTKGGVLRNVPVGGGCRKTKRSKPKPSPDDIAAKDRKSRTRSGSESSGVTVSTAINSGVPTSSLFDFPLEPRFFVPPSAGEQNFEPCSTVLESASDDGIFAGIGSFSKDPLGALGFNVSEISALKSGHIQQSQQPWLLPKMASEDFSTGLGDHAVEVEFNRPTETFGPLDWQGGEEDPVLFDYPAAVDQPYWSRNQWSDNDQPLYLP